MFFAVLIFCFLLQTKSVNVEPPIVINRYDDLIDRPDVQVSWSKEYPEYTLFQQALDGSKEQKIWKGATRKSLDAALISLTNAHQMLRTNERIKNQSQVIVINEGYSHFLRNFYRGASDDDTSFHIWKSTDPESRLNSRGYIVRQSLEGPLKSFVETRTWRILEGGFLQAM